jgi:hypothetical protein
MGCQGEPAAAVNKPLPLPLPLLILARHTDTAMARLLLLSLLLSVAAAAYDGAGQPPISRRSFPEGFIFGASSASYQVNVLFTITSWQHKLIRV